jgi:hypothetical protein
MKGHTRQLLEIAVVYLAVLIVADFFLTEYPVLTWLGLGIAFIIFSIFILDVLFELTPRRVVKPTLFEPRNEDELTHLVRLTKNALYEGNPEAVMQLSERLRSIVLRAAAYRINVSDTQLSDMAQRHSDLLEDRLQDREILFALTRVDPLVKPGSTRELHELLTKVESWLP